MDLGPQQTLALIDTGVTVLKIGFLGVAITRLWRNSNPYPVLPRCRTGVNVEGKLSTIEKDLSFLTAPRLQNEPS